MAHTVEDEVKSKRAIPAAIILIFLLIVLLYYWNLLINPSEPDLLGITVSYFLEPLKMAGLWGTLLFGSGFGGSGPFIKFNLLFIGAFGLVFVVQRTLEGRILWSSRPYLIFAILVTLIGSTINGIAQAEGWYWNFATNSPGNFDVATHFIAALIIGSWLVNINFMDMFGFRGRIGEFWEQFMIIAIFGIIAVGFEIIESLIPEVYFNVRGNSIQDMVVGVAGILVASWVYDKLVDWKEKGSDLPPTSPGQEDPEGI